MLELIRQDLKLFKLNSNKPYFYDFDWKKYLEDREVALEKLKVFVINE